MKKTFKITAAIAVLSMLVCALTACGKEPAKEDDKTAATTTAPTTVTTAPVTDSVETDDTVVGIWGGTLDYAQVLNETFGEDTFDPMVCGVILTFKDDGTYTLDLDDTALQTAWESQMDTLVQAMIEMMGVDMSAEEYFEEMGMTKEEFLESSLGAMDTEGSYEETESGIMLDEMFEAAYTLSGNTLTIDMMGIELSLKKTGMPAPTPPSDKESEEKEELVVLSGDLLVADDNGNEWVLTDDAVSAKAVWQYNDITGGADPIVELLLDENGAEKFREATQMNLGNTLHMCIGDEQISSPTVNEVITDGNVIITVDDYEEAQRIASLIEAAIL